MVAQVEPYWHEDPALVTADPFRTPTFTPFADPNWFFFAYRRGPRAWPPPIAH